MAQHGSHGVPLPSRAAQRKYAALALSTAHRLKAGALVTQALLGSGWLLSLPGKIDSHSVTAATERFVSLGKQLKGQYSSPHDLAAAIIHKGHFQTAGNPFDKSQIKATLKVAGRQSGPTGQKAIFAQAGKQYGIDPAILWGIYGIETGHGSNLSTSSAGAQGPMQFLPSTFATYGHGGNINSLKDSVNAAARYLKASGAPKDYRKAIFAYNHSSTYVQNVLNAAKDWNGGKGGPLGVPAPASPGAPVSAPSSGTGTAVRASVRAANAKRGSRASRPLSAGSKGPQTAKDASGTDQILSLLGFGNLSSTQPSPLSSFLGGPSPVRVAVGK